MLNRVILCGRTTTDLELKTTTSGKYVTSFSLAVDRDFSSSEERETDFINIVAWGNTAEFASRWFTKGKMMIVDGRLQVRSYTNQNNEKRYVTEVVAERIHFAGDKSKPEENTNFSTNNEDFTDVADTDDDLPF